LVEAAGRFRVYLGAAAGVGKTCAMLDEAQRRRRRGTDVVIGFVESHGRRLTAAAMQGLEVVPRKTVEYHGSRFEELDLEAILARRPDVVLVDELAHTNIPGSGRNEKRWQDVLDILDAGIDVIATVNIQHLESLADSAEKITGSPVRERVPDVVVRQADQIELVDSSPQQLRRRMLHGNIYPPDQVPKALNNFFRTENLAALRELTLHFLAEEATPDDLLAHVHGGGRDQHPDTRERILVAVTAVPASAAVLRRAGRLSARVKSRLNVVHVSTGRAESRRYRDHLAALRGITRDLGGEWVDLPEGDFAQTVLRFAHDHLITQIVVGSGPRPRWWEFGSHGSAVDKIISMAAEAGIDVHVVARPAADRTPTGQA
jgi:two-component system sensor histidine kinase KdpD